MLTGDLERRGNGFPPPPNDGLLSYCYKCFSFFDFAQKGEEMALLRLPRVPFLSTTSRFQHGQCFIMLPGTINSTHVSEGGKSPQPPLVKTIDNRQKTKNTHNCSQEEKNASYFNPGQSSSVGGLSKE